MGLEPLMFARLAAFEQWEETVSYTHLFITNLLETKNLELKEKEKEERLAKEVLDITLPGEDIQLGTIHPITAIHIFILKIYFNQIRNFFLIINNKYLFKQSMTLLSV